MKSGLNVEKLKNIKVELLNYMEELNSIFNSLEESFTIVTENLKETNSSYVNRSMVCIKGQFSCIKNNLMTYILCLDDVSKRFADNDIARAKQIEKNIDNIIEAE